MKPERSRERSTSTVPSAMLVSFTISRRGLFCPISNLFIEHRRLFTIARFNIAFCVSPLTTVKVRRMPSIVHAKVLTGALRKKVKKERERVYRDHHECKMKKRFFPSPARAQRPGGETRTNRFYLGRIRSFNFAVITIIISPRSTKQFTR